MGGGETRLPRQQRQLLTDPGRYYSGSDGDLYDSDLHVCTQSTVLLLCNTRFTHYCKTGSAPTYSCCWFVVRSNLPMAFLYLLVALVNGRFLALTRLPKESDVMMRSSSATTVSDILVTDRGDRFMTLSRHLWTRCPAAGRTALSWCGVRWHSPFPHSFDELTTGQVCSFHDSERHICFPELGQTL